MSSAFFVWMDPNKKSSIEDIMTDGIASASELNQQIAKVSALRAICADPEVEVIQILSYPISETAIISTWHLGIQCASQDVASAFMAALNPKQEHITETDWYTFTHRREMEKVVCYLSPRQMETVGDIADQSESSVESAIEWLIDRYQKAQDDEQDGAAE